MEVINDTEILVVHDVIQKLKIINIESLKVTREFQGFLPGRKNGFVVMKSRNGMYVHIIAISCS